MDSSSAFSLDGLSFNDPLHAVLGGSALLELNTIIRLSLNSAFVIALYNTPSSRQTLIEQITRQSTPQPNIVFSFDAEHLDAQDYLKQISAQGQNQRHVIHFCDIESVLEQAAPQMDRERDTLSKRPHIFILWLQNSARAPFARLAPNFFSRHSGVFDLRLSAAGQVQQVQKQGWDNLGTRYEDIEDWERLYSLYEKLLKEHEDNPSTLPETLAELHLRLGKLDYARSNPAADGHFQWAKQLLSENTPLILRAETLYYIGRVNYLLHSHYDAALDNYDAALKLYKAVGDRVGEANVRKGMGDVQQFRDDYDGALESYSEALKLYKAVGERLGEANVRKAMGDVQQFRKDMDGALESYSGALKLYKAVGARLGEANVRKAMGDVQQFRKDMDGALEGYSEALKLYKAVGAHVGEANVLQALGDVQQFRDDYDGALESYSEALKLYKAVGERMGEANVLKALGDVQQFRDDYDGALESYNAALKLYKVVGDGVGEANVLQALGDVQQFRDDYDGALESYNAALKLYKVIGERLGEANTLAALSRMAIQRGEIEQAEEQMAQIIAMRRAIHSLYDEGADCYYFAVSLFENGYKQKASIYAQKARAIFEQLNMLQFIDGMDEIIAAAGDNSETKLE